MRKHLQRFERSPDELDSQRAWIWPKPRLGFIFTEVAIVRGRGPAATASLLLQRLSKHFLAFQSHFHGNLI